MTTTVQLPDLHLVPPAMLYPSRRLPDEVTAIAPDGSQVRVLLTLPRGGMAHFRLLPGQVSRAVTHCTVEEIWYVISGTGQMWRSKDGVEDTADLSAGTCLTVPLGTRFQFRSTGSEALDIVGVTMPPWPGAGEAYQVSGPWPPDVPESSDPLSDAPPVRAGMPVVIRLVRDHVIVPSAFCGQLIEILNDARGAPNVAVAVDIRPTIAHYHTRFDEIYFVLDGRLLLRLYDPGSAEQTEHELHTHELCMIPRRVHHQVVEASPQNRLCVLSIPGFDPGDEQLSTVLR